MRERLRRILESLPCGVLVREADAEISVINPAAARLLGERREESSPLPQELQAALDQARASGGEFEFQQKRDESADLRWIAVRHGWLEQNDERSASVFILRDVTDAKRLEQEREEMRRQQALVEMSAMLAHEIRNPLGSLELFAGLLVESRLEGEIQ